VGSEIIPSDSIVSLTHLIIIIIKIEQRTKISEYHTSKTLYYKINSQEVFDILGPFTVAGSYLLLFLPMHILDGDASPEHNTY